MRLASSTRASRASVTRLNTRSSRPRKLPSRLPASRSGWKSFAFSRYASLAADAGAFQGILSASQCVQRSTLASASRIWRRRSGSMSTSSASAAWSNATPSCRPARGPIPPAPRYVPSLATGTTGGQRDDPARAYHDAGTGLRCPHPMGRRARSAPGQQQLEERLLRVQPVLGLVEHRRLRPLDDGVGNLLAAVGRQAVEDDRVRPRAAHEPLVHDEALEAAAALLDLRLLPHARPHVGVEHVRALRRLRG